MFLERSCVSVDFPDHPFLFQKILARARHCTCVFKIFNQNFLNNYCEAGLVESRDNYTSKP